VFNRISEQKHLSPYTVCNGKNVLTLEMTCNYKDEFWNMREEELLKLAKEDMNRIRFMIDINVLDYKVVRIKDAYEVYDLNFDEHLSIGIDYISNFRNLISTGRKGLFLQSDMHDSMGMGFLVGDFINNNKSPDEWYQLAARYIHEGFEGI